MVLANKSPQFCGRGNRMACSETEENISPQEELQTRGNYYVPFLGF